MRRPSTRPRSTPRPDLIVRRFYRTRGAPSGGRELVVVRRRPPLRSPLRHRGTEIGKRVGPKQRAVETEDLAAGGNLEVATLAGDHLVHPLYPIPGDHPGLPVE